MAGPRAVYGEAVDTGGTRYWTLARAAAEVRVSQTTLRKYLKNYSTDHRPQLTPVDKAVVDKLFGGASATSGGRPVSTIVLADEVRAVTQTVNAADDASSGQTTDDAEGGAAVGVSDRGAELNDLRAELITARAVARRWENLFRIEQATRVLLDERAREQLSQFTGPPDPEDLADGREEPGRGARDSYRRAR